MNAMDMPAAPPAKGPLTLSEMATELHPAFKDKANTEFELATRINAALDVLMAQGLVREWGFDAMGRTVYAPDRAFNLERHIPITPSTIMSTGPEGGTASWTAPTGYVIEVFWTYDTDTDK